MSVALELPQTLGYVFTNRSLPLRLFQFGLQFNTTVETELVVIGSLPIWYRDVIVF